MGKLRKLEASRNSGIQWDTGKILQDYAGLRQILTRFNFFLFFQEFFPEKLDRTCQETLQELFPKNLLISVSMIWER